KTPPRSLDIHNRRPALERLQPPSKKRDRTPPREERVSPSKKGKATERPEQRRRSPQGLSSWQSKARPRAEVRETTGVTARHSRTTTILLAALHLVVTRKIIAALFRRKL
ncbi:hypothetical protein A2U01_0058821, partial [Trifolium medium]|nr:hypothetical protein [Trifolium medium]